MADLTHIFGGAVPFYEERVGNSEPPEVQLRDAMRKCGLEPPATIVFDGNFHRFADGTGKGSRDDSGWYICYGDGIPAGRFGSHREGIDQNWRADIGRSLTPAEERDLELRIAEIRKRREAELAEKQSKAASVVAQIWEAAQPAQDNHPYLLRKNVRAHGAKITRDGKLIFPLYDGTGSLISLQYVAHTADGSDKRYHPGAKAKGGFDIIGNPTGATQIYLAEGRATAATVHEVTGDPCGVAYSAHSLPDVAKVFREKLPHLPLTIVADNDQNDVGHRYAQQAAAQSGARYVMPPREDDGDSVDANDYHNSGGNLLELLEPKSSGWLVSFEDFCSEPKPIRWLIKGWLQRNAMAMFFGPSGSGKSFTILDWCCRIASGMTDWCGYPVKNGLVVYLAGEGHDGMRARGAAWADFHKPKGVKLHISQHGVALDTEAGYIKARDEIRCLPEEPVMIVVDTLHRHLEGDENSNQDAGKMIRNLDLLKYEFGATILIVHHTGVSDDTQDRYRGAGAYKGAVENEIGMREVRDGKRRLRSHKTKDGKQPDDVFVSLEEVPVPGWLDEDGEQVTSAVVAPCDAPSKGAGEKGSYPTDQVHMFKRACYASGVELDSDGRPYVSKSYMSYWLHGEKITTTHAQLKKKLDESSGDFIHKLIASEIVVPCQYGWSVVDIGLSIELKSRKNV